MDQFERLKLFVEARGVKVVRKEDSRLMRFMAKLLFFAPNYLTEFSTTIGNTIYVTALHWGSVEVLAHEFCHVYDSRRCGMFAFALGYLFPQWLALLSLGALVAIAAPWWPSAIYFLAFLVFFLALIPWPAPWRVKFEARGYKMSLMVSYKLYGLTTYQWVLDVFSGWSYYWSCADVENEMKAWMKRLESGEPLGVPYDTVLAVLQSQDTPRG